MLPFCTDDLDFAFWDSSQEFLAVGFCCYSAVKNHHYAGVGFAADQAAEALLELDYRRGQLVVAKRAAAPLLYLFEPACEQWLIGNREGQEFRECVRCSISP